MERGYKKFIMCKDGKEKFEMYKAENVDSIETDKFSAEKSSDGDVLLNILTKKFLPTRKERFPKKGKHALVKSTIKLDEETFKKFVKFLNEFESSIS